MALELEVWQAPIVDNEGNIQPGAQVTVFNSDDTIATIYDDLHRTPRSNPFNVGSDALARFYAEPGRYRVQAQTAAGIAVFDDVDLSQKALREDLGYAGSFESGFTITEAGQFAIFKGADAGGSYLFRWDGELPKEVPPSSTPDSTGGVDVGAWLNVGDEVLRQELLTKTIKRVDTIDDLRNLESPEPLVYVSGYYTKDDGAFDSNIFKRVPHINKVDNGGSTIVVSIGNEQYAYELQFTGSIHIKAFGAKGDGVHNDTMAFLSAFKHGIPIHSDKDSNHIFDRLMVTGKDLLHEQDKSVPVYAEAIKPLIYFNGNDCKIELDPRIGEPAIYPLYTPRTIDFVGFYMFMFYGIDNIVLKNFKLQGGIFKNLLEDTKPLIEGTSEDNGTNVTINNTTGGIAIGQSSNILVENIEITEARKGLNLTRVDNSRVDHLTIKNTHDAFSFILCENISVDDCHHKHARFQLSNAAIGGFKDLGIVLDNEGNTLYQVVPEGAGGIKISTGHGMVAHGCQSMVFTGCSGYMSGSDCFRVQDSFGVPSRNIKTYNYTSTRAMRYALSIYGNSYGVEHYSPKILEFRYKDNIIQPKWVQDLVAELQSSQNKTEMGANVSHCHIENNGVKHTEHTAEALSRICEAIQSNAQSIAESAIALSNNANASIANAEAIKEAAKSLNGGGVEVQFGNGIHLSDVKHR